MLLFLAPVPADNNDFPINQLKYITRKAYRFENRNAIHQTRFFFKGNFLAYINSVKFLCCCFFRNQHIEGTLPCCTVFWNYSLFLFRMGIFENKSTNL
jgi:hypothetical protein